MLTQVIWWSSIALEVLLLFRGVRGGLASRYPRFYVYVSFVLFQDLFCLAFSKLRPAQDSAQDPYTYVYWMAEFLCVLVSCGIVFEIYRVGLAAYPGTASMARMLLGLIFIIVLVNAMVDVARNPQWWTEASAKDLEGTLRAIQGVAIVTLAALFLFYSIPFGRNLRGIILGFGLLICWSVVSLTFASYTTGKVHMLLAYLYPAFYPVVLILWLVPLWSYQASPVPKRVVNLELEYQRVARVTQRRLKDARGYLAKAVGS